MPKFVYSASLSEKPSGFRGSPGANHRCRADVEGKRCTRKPSIAYASATITIGKDFKNFIGSMGLNSSESSQTDTCLLGSSYDYDANMQVLVINDIPEPNQPGISNPSRDFSLRPMWR